jgi:hypothetical protein
VLRMPQTTHRLRSGNAGEPLSQRGLHDGIEFAYLTNYSRCPLQKFFPSDPLHGEGRLPAGASRSPRGWWVSEYLTGSDDTLYSGQGDNLRRDPARGYFINKQKGSKSYVSMADEPLVS